MAGTAYDLIKRDAKWVVNQGGFEHPMTITNPDKSVSLSLTGLASKHHISFDSDGNQVNTKGIFVTVDEQVLQDAGYPVRNSRSEVALLNHVVAYADSTGVVKSYVVRENYPDETLGIILLILGNYA